MSEVKKSRSQQKREDILNAALKTFKEQGVQATSMDQLAETANVSKRTVYNHFDSKETLVLSLLHEMWEQFMLRASVESID
jgi:TetR/AcrR family transcriptional regulator of autoinduction and epiphytic fitness